MVLLENLWGGAEGMIAPCAEIRDYFTSEHLCYVGDGSRFYSAYRKQDLYTGNMQETELPTVILENEHLKAVFLPTLGARLWQLYDKDAQRDLMLTNDEIAFGNLAVRDAWFCGGTEWNFGVIGHSPFTCSQVYTATLKTDDGTPVVRFYEYERIRGGTYQIDCWLPSGSKQLFVGVRIVNTSSDKVVPTYWWSNIAAEENPKARVIVPAEEAYIWGANDSVCKKKIFQPDTPDVTYPTNNPRACDHFWRTKDAAHKYIAYLDENGYGLCQTSSSAQLGRKLFVWGQGNGGHNWQQLLKTKGSNGHYVEIQAGLGQTQYECIPMPPNTAWSWVESYGALQVAPDLVHGEYSVAQKTVDEAIAGYDMDKVLTNATHMKKQADEILFEGSGWGALEETYRKGQEGRPLSYNLQFGNLGEEQKQWKKLLEEGSLGEQNPDAIPVSWMNHEGFTKLLEKAVAEVDKNNWYTHLHLGVVRLVAGQIDAAEALLKKSVELRENAWARYALVCLYWKVDRREEAVAEAMRCMQVKKDDLSLVRAVINILSTAKEHQKIIALIQSLSDEIKEDGCVELALVLAYLAEGNIEEAEKISGNEPAKYAPYVREGSIGPTTYWLQLEKCKRERNGESTENLMDQIPLEWDFRMG